MSNQSVGGVAPSGFRLMLLRSARALRTPMPYLAFIGIGLWLGIYFLLNEYWKLFPFYKIPGPVEVVTEWISRDPIWGTSLFTEDYYRNIWVSCRRIGIAFALATGLGVPLGLFMGWSQKFKDYTFPVLETLRPIPILAWVPLAILWFGLSDSGIIFVTAIGAIFAVTINTYTGVKNIDPSFIEAARNMGAKGSQLVTTILIPAAFPYMISGFKQGWAFAWRGVIGAELLFSFLGLGFLLNVGRQLNDVSQVIAMMLVIMGIGILIDGFVFKKLEDKVMTKWGLR